MKTTTIFLLILSVFLIGCRDKREQRTETITTTENREAVPQEGAGWENNIRLDDGSQWLVRQATTEGVQRMEEIIENDSSGSIEEYRELGDELYQEHNKLERHREHAASTQNLKIYLAPLEEKIEELQNVRTTERGATLKFELKEHLEKYSNYFL